MKRRRERVPPLKDSSPVDTMSAAIEANRQRRKNPYIGARDAVWTANQTDNARRGVTAENLTDEEILQRRREIVADPVRFSRPQHELLAECDAALVPDGQRVVAVWYAAREKIANALNERAAAINARGGGR